MSSYSPPIEYPQTIFNPSNWGVSTGNGLDTTAGDKRYLKLTGGTEKGNVNFLQGLKTNDIESVSGGIVTINDDLETTGNFDCTQDISCDGEVNILGLYKINNVTQNNTFVYSGAPSNSDGLLDNLYIDSNTRNFYNRKFPTYTLRSFPTFTGTVIPVGSTRVYTTIASALAAASNGDILFLDAETFSIGSTQTINKTVEIRGTKATTILSGSLTSNVLSITASGCYIHDLTITNPNTGSTAGCLTNSASDFYCSDVIFTTNEFGFTNTSGQCFIKACSFVFTGTPDSHRYIYFTGASGDIVIQNNTFQAVNTAGTPVTRFMVMTAGTYTSLTKVIITGNTESSSTVLSQFFLQDSLISATAQIQFFFDNNVASLVNNGIIIFYASNALSEYEFIAFNNNNFGGASISNSTTGLIKLDLPSSGSIGSTIFVAKDNNYTGGITATGYATASTGSDLISYNTTVLSFPNITLYSSIWILLFRVGVVGGSDTQIQYNDGGVFNGSSTLVYNKTTNALTIPSTTCSGSLTLSGIANATSANALYYNAGVITYGTAGGGGGTPGGTNTQVQFNDSGSFGGDSGLTYDKTTDTLTVAGGLVVDTNTFIADATNNRIGIINASPQYSLDATGGIFRFLPDTDSTTWTTFTAPTGISFQGFNASGFAYGMKMIAANNRSNTIWFASSSAGNRGTISYANSTDNMTFATANTTRLTLTTTGFSSTLPFDCTNLTATGSSVLLSGIPASTQSNVLYYNATTKAVSYGNISATPGGTDTQIQFNDGGAFGGDSGLTYNKTTDTLTVAGGLIVDTNTLSVDATNNRVGINNTNPAYALDIDGGCNVRTGHVYRLNGVEVLSTNALGTGILSSSLTSLGTLSSLTCSGAVNFTGLTSSSQSNIVYYNSSTGALSYSTAPTGAPGGTNTQVQFNDSGAFGGDSGLTFNKTSDVLTIAGGLTVATNKLFVDNVNARVGVNTATPAYGLDVGSGDINLGSTSFWYKVNGVNTLSNNTLGTAVTTCSLNTYQTSSTGDWKFGATNVVNGTNNGRNTAVGPYQTASGWTSSSTSHTFSDSTYKVNVANDNLCGIVTIFCVSKNNNSTAVYQGVLSKRYLNALSLTQLSKTQNGITTFTIGISGDNITVTTDSQCQCCMQYEGAV